jgi:hypothetical protein
MKPTTIEKAVIQRFLQDADVALLVRNVNLEEVEVADRSFSGMGFLTEFVPSKAVKVMADGVSIRWGKVDANLNAMQTEAGFIVYVDDGVLNAVEGFIYGGGSWPESIDAIELYDFRPGEAPGGHAKSNL